MDWRAILAVAVGGGIGSVLRFVIGQVALQRFGPGFPWGTLVINITGSFLIGVVAGLAATRSLGVTPLVRVFVATGVLGGYTTFSTYSLDAMTLFGEGSFSIGTAYTLGSVFLGVAAAYAGLVVARIASP